MIGSIIFGTVVISLITAHAYFRPNVDFDNENEQIIIHYNWKGRRKTYVL